MNRLICLFVAFFSLAVLLPHAAYAGEVEEYTMPKKDGQHGDKTVNGQLIFYDMGGPSGNAPTAYAGYTRFVPASEGQQIRITFDEFELTGVAAVYVYDGDISFTKYRDPVPEGYLAKLEGTLSGQSFESTSGSLSVLYHNTGYSGSAPGWIATVEEFIPADMVWGSVTATTPSLSAFRGQKDAPIMRVNLLTEGSCQPFSCTELKFSLEGTTDINGISNLRVLYSKGTDKPSGEIFGQAAEPGNATLTFYGNQQLRGGNNYFWLVADVSADATGSLDAVLTGAVAGDVERVTSAISAEGAVAIENSARLSQNPITYTITQPLTFYDDGGADGNISEGFDGTATFRPSSPGKVIRATFTSLELFNTSSTGKNDILNIYSGTEKSADQLLATLLKDPTPTSVTSIAADGTLTISLTSVAGTPKQGFVATIEEIEPQNMSIQLVEVTHPESKSASAGSEGERMLLIRINTAGTLAPCFVSSMAFTNSSTAPLTRASLMWLGKDAGAAGVTVGETTNTSDEFTITLAAPQPLEERDNYFLLTYDIAPYATNGLTLDATLNKVNADYSVVAGSPEGERVIENIWYSDDATVTKTIYGDWKFRNKKSEYSSYSYDATNGDQITTFLPGTEGKTIELEFSKFKLRTASYIPEPTFKVFDGTDKTAPVLWAASAADFVTGPMRTLRATNPDGALTVLFNSNGGNATSGYGFEADVREYVSVPMSMGSVIVAQLNNGAAVRPGATDVPLLSVEANTVGDKDPLSLDQLTVDLKDNYQIISKVKLYATGASSEFATSTLVAEASVEGRNVTLTPASAYAMPEKKSYLWIALDMNEAFASDLTVDASISELKISGNAVVVTDPDPEGALITKNIYYFEGGNKQVYVSGSMLFYDDGGPEGKYTNTSKGSVTFLPAAPSEVIRMTVQNFYTNYQDYLYFYEGASPAEDAPYIQRLSSSKNAEDVAPIISKAEDGAITVKFEPKKNNINDGWEILVESFVPQPMAVKGVEVTPVNDVKMLRGSTDNKLMKIAVRIEGEKESVTIDKFEFSALESDKEAISAAKLWYTGSNDSYDVSDAYATANITDAAFSFEGNKNFDTTGTYYFWLAYDIAPEAANDSKIQAQFLSLSAGGNIVAPLDEKKVLVTVQEGMHGVFSVGTSGEQDYRTLSEALDAIKDGIDGPVVFELEDGNYNELVTIPAVIGSSELNTLTICSKSGKRENVTISYDTYRDPGSSNYDKRYGVVTFDGIDHCTLKNLTVTTGATTFPGLVFFRNKSEYVTLDNCVIKMAKSTDNAKGSYLVYQYAKNEANCNSNYATIQNCLLDGGYIGVGLTGTGYVALPKQRGGLIRNNVFRNQGSKAIYIANEEDAVVCGNDILIEGTTTSTPYGMDLNEVGGDLSVFGNVIRIKECTSNYTPNPVGLYIRIYNIANVRNGNRRIYNNEINITDAPGLSATGIRINNEIPGIEIVNNTLRMAATNTEADALNGIYIAGSIKGGRIMNNILRLDTPGFVIYSQRKPYLEGATLSNNVGYVPGNKFGYIGGDPNASMPEGFVEGNQSFDNFCLWAPMTASFNEQTEFLSDNVLEPASAGSLLNDAPIEYVTTDLYGAERSSTPTIGAYEYAESTIAPALAESYPIVKDITHDTASFVVKSSLTGTINYAVFEADEPTPDADAVKNEDQIRELRKGVETVITLDGLRPNTSYQVYAVLSSLRGLDSEVIASEQFTTTYEPTRIATFEEATEEEMRLLDGTMSFTGFSVEEITDGVAPAPNNKAAVMDDEYAVIQLTNAPDLGLEGLFMRNDASVTLTAKDFELKTLATKQLEPSALWRYVELKDMGLFTYLELESEGNVAIDNVGALPLSMILNLGHDEATPVSAGEPYSISVTVDGGVSPYTYEWRDAARNIVGESASLSLTPKVSNTYSVTVTDARGAVASASTKLRVLGDMAIATFDDLYLAPDSHWCGDTDDEDYIQGSFFSGSFEFNNLYMADWDSWSFFGYSNHTSTSFSSYVTDQWNSAVGHGVDDSANYGVVFISPYMGKTLTTLSNAPQGQVIPGMYITNSAWVVDAILHGDGLSDGPFALGDKLTLQLTGTAEDGSVTTLETLLADYTTENEQDRWYLDSWQWIDLSKLGSIVSLEWNITSTRNNAGGMTTPAYVCIDNLGGSRPVAEGSTVLLKVNEEAPTDCFDLATFFSFSPEEGTIRYEIETDDERLALSGSKVTCTAKSGETLSLIAHASQRGRHEWVSIPVSVTDKPLGLASAELEGVSLYPNPADAFVKVNTDAASYDVTIFATDGRMMMSQHGLTGTRTLDVSSLSAGTYVVKLQSANGLNAVHKLIVKH